MPRTLKSILAAGVAALAATTFVPAPVQAQEGEPIRVALGDLPEMETLMFLVGLERAKERGVKADVTFFAGEELAIQAIVAGQADLGVGSPYAVIQRASAPVRMFYQISRIVFFPVATSEIKTWQDMEGKSLTYHQRGGPLEPLAKIVTEAEGVTLGRPNYVPGSENRVVALMQGHIDAALIDLLNKNMLMEKEPGKFNVLSWTDEVVTDEALFARQEWLEGSKEQVNILVEELLRTAQDVCKDPKIIASERDKYKLLPDLPQELSDIVASYHQEAIAAGVYSCDGGGTESAEIDIKVFSEAGQLTGSAEELSVDKFWNVEALNAAREKLNVEPGQIGVAAGEGGAAATGGTPK